MHTAPATTAPAQRFVIDEFVRLLQMHAAKEEVGLFVQPKSSTPLGDQIDVLCAASTTTCTAGPPTV